MDAGCSPDPVRERLGVPPAGSERGRTIAGIANPLIDYDWKIVRAALRAIGRTWHDRVAVAFFLVVVPAVAVDRLTAAPPGRAAIATLAAALASSALLSLILHRRLDFLATESPFASEALDLRHAALYRLFWHLPPASLLLALLAVGRPALIAAGMAGYALGVAGTIAALAGFDRVRDHLASWAMPSIAPTSWRRRPRTAAIVTALGIAGITLQLAMPATTESAVALSAVATFIVIAFLSPISEREVRFLAMVGYGLSDSLTARLRYPAWSLAAMTAATLPFQSLLMSLSVLAVGLLVLLFRVAQLMAVRAFPGRIADTVLMLVIGAIAMVGGAVPPALPFVTIAVLVWLGRRASRVTWLQL